MKSGQGSSCSCRTAGPTSCPCKDPLHISASTITCPPRCCLRTPSQKIGLDNAALASFNPSQ